MSDIKVLVKVDSEGGGRYRRRYIELRVRDDDEGFANRISGTVG